MGLNIDKYQFRNFFYTIPQLVSHGRKNYLCMDEKYFLMPDKFSQQAAALYKKVN